MPATTIPFGRACKIMGNIERLSNDSATLKKLIERTILLDEILNRTNDETTEIRFSGTDTHNITCPLSFYLDSSESSDMLELLMDSTNEAIEAIISKYPSGTFETHK